MPSEQPMPACISAAPMEAHARIPDAPHRRRSRMTTALRSIIERAGLLLRLWLNRMRESDELNRLSERELRDFGIDRYDVEYAARKPFWRA